MKNNSHKILIVDDQSENREILCEAMQEKGYLVETASSANEAMSKLNNGDYHLLLTDINMPGGMNGLELLEKLDIRNKPYEAIVMTGTAGLSTAKRAIELRAFDYITRPFDIEYLEMQVRNALEKVELKIANRRHLENLEAEIKTRSKDLEQTMEIAKRGKEITDDILSNMEEGLIVIDNGRNVMLMNSSAEQIVRIAFSECLGLSVDKVAENCPNLKKVLSIVERSSSYSKSNTLSLENRQKTIGYYAIKASDIYNENMEAIGKIITLSDHTAKVNADKLRDSFLSTIAHELRTPATIIFNFIQILQKYRSVPREVTDSILVDMKMTGVRLMAIVENIISVANLSAFYVPMAKESVSIEKLIKSEVDKLQFDIREHEAAVVIANEIQGNVWINEPKILGNAIQCLISNAVKFGPKKGEVLIRAKLQAGEIETCLLLEINDHGPGIPKCREEYLFESFTQEEEPLTRRHSGIGAGLFIVKRTMEVLRGKVIISHREGEGTKVSLQIPIHNNGIEEAQEVVNG